MIETITGTDRTVTLLTDLDTVHLPKSPQLMPGLQPFRTGRATGVLDVVDPYHATRWLFEFTAGEITTQAAVVGIAVPPELLSPDGLLASFHRNMVLSLDELQH